VKMKFALALIAITTALIPHAPAMAQRMPGMGGRGMLGGPMMAAYLGLSQDQIAQLKTLRSSQEATFKPLMEQLETYRKQLKEMTQSNTPLNAGALANLANGMAQVQAKLTIARAQVEWQVFNNILTQDQQAKLASLQQQMQEMRNNWKNGPTASPSANQ
jgi:Spy/CpxP family protein refolding chaperone